MEITKTIIPAAGFGTRFLPYTKAVPKEMLPLLNKPALQYIIEEALSSEINQFIVVTNKDKQAIADHFDYNIELDTLLKERGIEHLVAPLQKIIRNSHFTYVRQPEPLGLGQAIWTARHTISSKEYFAVCLPDDIIISKTPALSQLLKIARQEKASVIAVEEVPVDNISSYGVIGIKKQITPNLYQVSHVIEKPSKKDAPSNLAIVGRYVLSQKIFSALENIETDERGELQLTDAIATMIHGNEKVFAFKIQGMRYDIGNPIGWVKAVIGCALQDPQYAPHISSFLADKEKMDAFLLHQTRLIEQIF